MGSLTSRQAGIPIFPSTSCLDGCSRKVLLPHRPAPVRHAGRRSGVRLGYRAGVLRAITGSPRDVLHPDRSGTSGRAGCRPKGLTGAGSRMLSLVAAAERRRPSPLVAPISLLYCRVHWSVMASCASVCQREAACAEGRSIRAGIAGREVYVGALGLSSRAIPSDGTSRCAHGLGGGWRRDRLLRRCPWGSPGCHRARDLGGLPLPVLRVDGRRTARPYVRWTRRA